MTTADTLYRNAILSDAAYVDLPTGLSPPLSGQPLVDALGATGRLTATELAYIREHFDLVAWQTGGAGSFQAMVFADKSLQANSPGKYVLSIRGTQEALDLGVDAFLAVFGTAAGQDSALISFVQFLAKPTAQGGLGLIAGSLDATGHSLGGHLVQFLASQFPSLLNNGYTFNGAGLGNGLDYLLAELRAGELVYKGDASKITNLLSAPGVDLVESPIATGVSIGSKQQFFAEDRRPPAFE